jgi:hypothetical protein
MQKRLKLVCLALICLAIASCGSGQRFMNFSWQTSKQEVINSVKRWGFTFNDAKQRWDKGMLNGFKCNKLQLWFSADSMLEGAEAKYQDNDSATSTAIFDRFASQLTREHGKPDICESATGYATLTRLGWRFNGASEQTHDMIVLDHFDNYVLFHAARNMPPLFELAPSSAASAEE